MIIKRNSWHYRLYIFMRQAIGAWKGDDDYAYEGRYEPRNGIGLCPYMRTILIWGPLALLTNALPLGLLFATFYLIPFGINQLAGIMYLFGYISLAILIVYGLRSLGDRRKSRAEIQNEPKEDQRQKEESSGFFKLVKEYIVSTKTKICPVMEVK